MTMSPLASASMGWITEFGGSPMAVADGGWIEFESDIRPIFSSSGRDLARPKEQPERERARVMWQALAHGQIAMVIEGGGLAIADIGLRNGAALGAIRASVSGRAQGTSSPFNPTEEAIILAMLENL